MNKSLKANLTDLLDQLDQQQVHYDRKRTENFITSLTSTPSSSLLIQILSAIGVIFATTLIILTMVTAGILNDKSSISHFVFGGIALSLAFFLSKNSDKQGEVHPALQQLTLAAIAVGKILICTGFVIATGIKSKETIWIVAITMAVLSAITYVLLKSRIDRFISPLITVIITYFAIFYGMDPNNITQYLFILLYSGCLAIGLYLLLSGNLKASTQPLGFALIMIPCIFVPLWPVSAFNIKTLNANITTYAMMISLAAAFLTTAYIIAREQNALRSDFIAMTIGLTGLLTFYGPLNLLAALILLLLGHYKSNLALTVLGVISFIYFLIAYYYGLDLTLLEKSGLLLISGSSLLIIWAYLHFVINKKGASK